MLSLLPSSEFYLAICVRAGIVRVSVGLLGLDRSFFIIGGEGLFVPAATVGLAMVYSWICADRDWVVFFDWKRYRIVCIVRDLDCMGYPFL